MVFVWNQANKHNMCWQTTFGKSKYWLPDTHMLFLPKLFSMAAPLKTVLENTYLSQQEPATQGVFQMTSHWKLNVVYLKAIFSLTNRINRIFTCRCESFVDFLVPPWPPPTLTWDSGTSTASGRQLVCSEKSKDELYDTNPFTRFSCNRTLGQ